MMKLSHRSTRWLVLLVAVALAACSGAGTGDVTTTAGDVTTTAGDVTTTAGDVTTTVGQPETADLRITSIPGVSTNLPLILAVNDGYFEDVGLSVELIEAGFGDLSQFIPGLGRQYEIVMSTPGDFFAAVAQDIDVVSVAGAYFAEPETSPYPSVLSAEAESIEDLAGKTVATNSLVGLQYAALLHSFELNGVEDVEIIAVPFATMNDQLRAGQVDAVTQTEPGRTLLLEEGYNDVFVPVWEATGSERAPTAWWTAGGSWAAENPNTVAAFRTAMQRAYDALANDSDLYTQMVVENQGMDPELADKVPQARFDSELTIADLELFVDFMIDTGQIPELDRDVDLTQFIFGS